jgi:hypothetical protein
VGRSELVRNRETLQAEHAPTAAGELEQGGTPHPADADDDRIEALATHPSSVPPPQELAPKEAQFAERGVTSWCAVFGPKRLRLVPSGKSI